MRITRRSILTGDNNTLDMPVTQKQLDSYYKLRTPIMDAFPQLSPVEQEFIRHGVMPAEHDKVFGDDKRWF
jgi:hypothetical protein